MHTKTVEIGSNSQGNSPSLATVLSSLTWGGSPSYPSYEGRLEDVPAAAGSGSAAAAGGSGTPPAAAGSPPAGQNNPPSSSGSGAAGSGDGGQGGQGGGTPNPNPNPNDDNLRTLRSNYEALKPWEKVAQTVKDPNAAVTAYQRVTTMYNEASQLATQLGYTPESLKEAFEDDPIDTLSHLRREFAEAQKNPEFRQRQSIEKMIAEQTKKALSPIEQQLNKERTDKAFSLYTSELDRLVADDKLGFGADVPPAIKETIVDLVDMMLPDNVLAEIKTSGRLSGIQPVFEEIKTRLLSVVNAFNEYQAGRASRGNGNPNPFAGARKPAGGGNPPPNNGQYKEPGKLTLDDILNDPNNLPGVRAGKY